MTMKVFMSLKRRALQLNEQHGLSSVILYPPTKPESTQLTVTITQAKIIDMADEDKATADFEAFVKQVLNGQANPAEHKSAGEVLQSQPDAQRPT